MKKHRKHTKDVINNNSNIINIFNKAQERPLFSLFCMLCLTLFQFVIYGRHQKSCYTKLSALDCTDTNITLLNLCDYCHPHLWAKTCPISERLLAKAIFIPLMWEQSPCLDKNQKKIIDIKNTEQQLLKEKIIHIWHTIKIYRRMLKSSIYSIIQTEKDPMHRINNQIIQKPLPITDTQQQVFNKPTNFFFNASSTSHLHCQVI